MCFLVLFVALLGLQCTESGVLCNILKTSNSWNEPSICLGHRRCQVCWVDVASVIQLIHKYVCIVEYLAESRRWTNRVGAASFRKV